MAASTQSIECNRNMAGGLWKMPPFCAVCKWRMWTEMENANIEKLCRYFSDKKLHQDLTCFSVALLYLIIYDMSKKISWHIHQLYLMPFTFLSFLPVFYEFVQKVLFVYIYENLSSSSFIFIAIHIFAYTALKPNRVHSEQHLVLLFISTVRWHFWVKFWTLVLCINSLNICTAKTP